MATGTLRLAYIQRTQPFLVKVDGISVEAYEGETVAAVLASIGRRALFTVPPPYAASRLYCNMGVCMQCLVIVDGQRNVRACLALVVPGMEIGTCDEY